jgi:hypothetical protein
VGQVEDKTGPGDKKRTSSLLVCFCRLALTEEEAPASLVPVCAVSRTGLGIPEEAAGLLAKGMAPRACPRFGVPRIVPGLTDMMALLLRLRNGTRYGCLCNNLSR